MRLIPKEAVFTRASPAVWSPDGCDTFSEKCDQEHSDFSPEFQKFLHLERVIKKVAEEHMIWVKKVKRAKKEQI